MKINLSKFWLQKHSVLIACFKANLSYIWQISKKTHACYTTSATYLGSRPYLVKTQGLHWGSSFQQNEYSATLRIKFGSDNWPKSDNPSYNAFYTSKKSQHLQIYIKILYIRTVWISADNLSRVQAQKRTIDKDQTLRNMRHSSPNTKHDGAKVIIIIT